MPKPLVPVRLPVPGSFGLNLEKEADILPAQWATVADNMVFDDSGRLAARKGTQDVTSAIAGDPDVETIFEYIDSSGSSLLIFAAENKIYKLVGSTKTDISGTITTPTADDWKFQNFNGKCVGFQSGHAPIVLSSVAGTFADITLSGTQQPTTAANEVLAAYGRLWVIDGTSLKYSDALDETSWNSLFDLSTVWLNGMDVGVALADFNGYLTVFGRDSIIVYSNPWSPTGGGGIDTSTMELVENIGGVGCISRDTVIPVGKDIIFLSNEGLLSLGRTIQEKSMPMREISRNINDELVRLVQNDSPSAIKAVYDDVEGAYILSLPASDVCFYFNLRRPLPDQTYRITKWNRSFTGMFYDSNGTLYLGRAGHLMKYSGYYDNADTSGLNGTDIGISFTSGWTDLSDIDPQFSSLTKIPKSATFLILGGSSLQMFLKWAFDFQDIFSTYTKTLPASGGAEWGEAEWGEAEWSGGLVFNNIKAPLSSKGLVIKFGISTSVSGEALALQFLNLLLKTGRIA